MDKFCPVRSPHRLQYREFFLRTGAWFGIIYNL
jgi:hypothetical protein